MEEKWVIRYTNIDTDKRETYMNIGFEKEESANGELRKIKDQKKKLNGMGYYFNRDNDFHKNRVCLIGKNFRIKKIKIKKL